MLSTYLYLVQKRRDIFLKEVRVWKSLTNKLEDMKDYDKKFKNATAIKVDGYCMNIHES